MSDTLPTAADTHQEPGTTDERILERLSQIEQHLHHINNRDRVRLYGSTVRSLVTLIPTVIFLVSAWYIYAHGAELLTMMTQEIVEQTAGYSENSMNSFYDQLKSTFGGNESAGSSDFKVK